jgi:hypothetical protein
MQFGALIPDSRSNLIAETGKRAAWFVPVQMRAEAEAKLKAP